MMILEKNCSKTAHWIYRIGHDGMRILKRMFHFDRCYENKHYFDLMATVLSTFNELS